MPLQFHVCPVEIIDGQLGAFPPPPNGFLGDAGPLLHGTADTIMYEMNRCPLTTVKSAEVTITPASPEVGAQPGSLLYGYSFTTDFGIWIGETIVLEPQAQAPEIIVPEIVEPESALVGPTGEPMGVYASLPKTFTGQLCKDPHLAAILETTAGGHGL
jgi:hypothetical protein